MLDPDLENELYHLDQYLELKARMNRILENLIEICSMTGKDLPVVLNSMLDDYEPIIVEKTKNYSEKDLPF